MDRNLLPVPYLLRYNLTDKHKTVITGGLYEPEKRYP